MLQLGLGCLDIFFKLTMFNGLLYLEIMGIVCRCGRESCCSLDLSSCIITFQHSRWAKLGHCTFMSNSVSFFVDFVEERNFCPKSSNFATVRDISVDDANNVALGAVLPLLSAEVDGICFLFKIDFAVDSIKSFF